MAPDPQRLSAPDLRTRISIGVQICTEMWFMEWARHYARSRAELLCIPRVTPREDVDK
jgi:predicted amidohydrolase